MKRGNNSQVRKQGVRNYVEANRPKTRPNFNPVFHEQGKSDDLSPALVKNARKSGTLNLSGRNLVNVPSKVWKINEMDDHEKSTMSVSLDNPSPEKWWEFADLQKLIVANNFLTEIPKDISSLASLNVLDAHDNQIIYIAPEIAALEHLQKLDLSHNKITVLPGGVYDLKRLVELKLNNNLIQEISTQISNLASLRTLDFSHNSLSTIAPDIGFLGHLVALNISENNLKDLPPDMNGLTNLQTLDLSANSIEKVPGIFNAMKNLELLYLQKNKLQKIPDVSNCSKLKELYLQNNQIKSFSSEVFQMTQIQLIDLRCNKVLKLEVDKNHLELLDRFYLDNNDIGILPDHLCLLPSLKALSLEANPLKGVRVDILQRGTNEIIKYLRGKLPKEVIEQSQMNSTAPSQCGNGNGNDFVPTAEVSTNQLQIDPYKLKNTRTLNLASKNIREFEDDVFDVSSESKVTIIDVSKNEIQKFPESFSKCCENLTELKLDFNKFTSLPAAISKCCRLQFLSFQNNQVEDLPIEFSNLKNLREINFAYNRFVMIPKAIYDIPGVEIIIGANNKITSLEVEKLKLIRRLAVLDLRNNSIAQVPPELGLMNQIKSLNLEGNAFRVPSYHILCQGTDAVMRYLQNRVVKE